MKKWLVALFVFLLPAWAHAEETARSGQADAASSVGRVIGMLLFGYIVMKMANRNKSEDDDRPRGTSKILIGVLVAVILVAIFH